MPIKVRSRQHRFCRTLLEESIGRPTPCWVSIDKLARLLGVSYEAAFVVAYDCEKAGLVRYQQSGAVKSATLAIEPPHSVCLTAGGWRLMRKPRSGKGGRQSTPASRRRAAN
jgi:hypothetical protein